jgi:hypothetical protein
MKMDMTPIPAPIKGFQEKRALAEPDPQYTPDCLNVVPFDRFEDRLRLGTRPAEYKVFDIPAVLKNQGGASTFGTSSYNETTPDTRQKIQFMGAATVYDTNNVIKDVMMVYDGRVYVCDSGDTFIGNGQQAVGMITPVALSDSNLIDSGDNTHYNGTSNDRVQLDDRPFDPDTLVEGVQFFNDFYLIGKKRTGLSLPSEHANSRDGTFATAWVNLKLQAETGGTRGSDSLNGRYIMYDYRERDLTGATQASTNHMPPDNFGHLTKWGSRLVATGFIDTPTNYIISGVSTTDAILNWQFASGDQNPIFGYTSAGTTNSYGTLGDNILFAAPFGEGGLLFGCTSSVQFFTQDPLFGQAQVRSLSRSIGCASQRSFAYGPSKEIYILNHNGVYGIAPNQFNVDERASLSDAALGNFFSQTDFKDKEPMVTYDYDMNGLWIWLADDDPEIASINYYYDIMTQSWWGQAFYSNDFRGAMSSCNTRLFGDRDAPRTFFGSTGGKISTFARGKNIAYDGEFFEGVAGSTDGLPAASAALRKITSFYFTGPITLPNKNRVELRAVEVDLDINDPDVGNAAKTSLDRPQVVIRSGDTANECAASRQINKMDVSSVSRPTFDGGTHDQSSFSDFAIDGGGITEAFFPDLHCFGGFAQKVEGTYQIANTRVSPNSRIYEQSSPAGGKNQIAYEVLSAVAQVMTLTPSGTLAQNDQYTIKMTSGTSTTQTLTVTLPSTPTVETTVDAIVSAWNGSSDSLFAAVTAVKTGSGGSSKVQLTADSAGTPFYVTAYPIGSSINHHIATAITTSNVTATTGEWRIQSKNNADDNGVTGFEPYSANSLDLFGFAAGDGDSTPPFNATYNSFVTASGTFLETVETNDTAPIDRTETTLSGVLYPGRNEVKRCRIRDGAISVGIKSTSRPFIVEQISIGVVPVGPHRNIKSRS